MKKHNPPLNALKAYEAVARNVSITKAAAELHVTHAAVSQQIKLLENYLSIPLLQREGKRIRLTAAGRLYAEQLSAAFSAIDQATLRLMAQQQPLVLTVAMPPTFALRWFIPRLPDFQQRYPQFELRLSTLTDLSDLTAHAIDAAIYFGTPTPSDLQYAFLLPDYLMPVCSPHLKNATAAFTKSPKAKALKFIYVSAPTRQQDWRAWCAGAGINEPPPAQRLYFQDTRQALQAAHAGLGIAMAHEPLVSDDLQARQLITPLKFKLKTSAAYYLVFPTVQQDMPKIKCFREWLFKITLR